MKPFALPLVVLLAAPPVLADAPASMLPARVTLLPGETSKAFTLNGEKASSVKVVKVVLVQRGTEDVPLTSVKVEFAPPSGVNVSLIPNSTVPRGDFSVPGEYKVVFSFVDDKAAELFQLTAEIEVPAAAISVAEKSLTRDVVTTDPPDSKFFIATLRETSGMSDASVRGKVIITDAKNDEVLRSASDCGDVVVPRGGSAKIKCALDSRFEVGLTSALLVLESPALTTQIDAPVSVRVHRPEAFVILAILVGIILSWTMRVWLVSSIELQKNRVVAEGALEALTERLSASTDKTLSDGLGKAKLALASAIKNASPWSPKDLAEAVIAASAAQKAAIDDHTRRLEETKKALAGLDGFELRRGLPSELSSVYFDVRQVLGRASQRLDAGDAYGAELELSKLSESLTVATKNAAAWAAALARALTTVAWFPLPCSFTRPEAQELLRPLEREDKQTISAILNSVASIRTGFEVDLNRVLFSFRDEVIGAMERMRGAKVEISSEKYTKATKLKEIAANGLGRSFEQRLAELADLRGLWEFLQGETAKAANQTIAAQNVASLLASGSLAEAARYAFTDAKREPFGGAARTVDGFENAPPPPTLAAVTSSLPLRTLAVPTSPGVEAKRVLDRYELLRSSMTLLGVVLVGWWLQRTNWYGTPGDLVACFSWGYTAALSVDTIVAFATQAKRA